jgi:dihydropteroate synthase
MGGKFAEDPVFGDLALALAPRALWSASLWPRPEGFVHLALRESVLREHDSGLFREVSAGASPMLTAAARGSGLDEAHLFCPRSKLWQRSSRSPAAASLLAARDHAWEPPPEIGLMGVVNVTPDSFSDGTEHSDPIRAVEHGLGLAREGAVILDVGGESTRPGADPVPDDEELRRVVPVIERLARRVSTPISVDTTKASVARAALDAGATIVNDVSAGRFDDAMLPLVAERKAGYVAMHMQGTPRDMQANPTYVDVVADVLEFLRERCRAALEAGVEREKLWIDPGIGFGKTLEHNLELLARLPELRSLGLPLCVGVSRKSFIAKIEAAAGVPTSAPDDRIGGTAAALTFAVLGGASVLRVHDVAVMAQAARVARALSWKSGERS